jgi:hypothetical protein
MADPFRRASTVAPPSVDPLPLLARLTQTIHATRPGWADPHSYYGLCNALLTATTIFMGQHVPCVLTAEELEDPARRAARQYDADRTAVGVHQAQLRRIIGTLAEPWNPAYPYHATHSAAVQAWLAACIAALTAALARVEGASGTEAVALIALAAWVGEGRSHG